MVILKGFPENRYNLPPGNWKNIPRPPGTVESMFLKFLMFFLSLGGYNNHNTPYKSTIFGHFLGVLHWFILLMTEIPNNHLGWCWNPINNGKNYLSLNWLAGFRPSTAAELSTWSLFVVGKNHVVDGLDTPNESLWTCLFGSSLDEKCDGCTPSHGYPTKIPKRSSNHRHHQWNLR